MLADMITLTNLHLKKSAAKPRHQPNSTVSLSAPRAIELKHEKA